MKKKITTGIAAMAFAIALTLNVSISMSNDGNVNDVTFSNVEALADEGISATMRCDGSGSQYCYLNNKSIYQVIYITQN